MKFQRLFYSVLAAAALLVSCKETKEEPSLPSLAVSQTELSVEQGGGSATVTVTSNRPWSITTNADWLAFNPTQGGASDAPVNVTVTALPNNASDRTATFNVKTDFDYRTVTVTQPGPKGVDPTQTATGKGTVDDPYNVLAAIQAVSNLTWTSNDDYQATGVVYVIGKISRISENGTFTQGGSFGNASFYISADGSTNNEFQVYRTLYLGNKKYKSGQTDIKVGDEVVICGKLMNYKGNTPETVSNDSYVYSINGETSGGGGSEAVAKGSGTLEDPYNPAGAAAAVANLKWTSNTDYETTDNVYVKGIISRIASKGTYTESGSYGNATFFISEDGKEADEFEVFHALYLGNKKYEEGKTDIKVGDEVILYGKLMNYHGNTPETVSNGAYLYSLNGVSEGEEQIDPSEYENAPAKTVDEFIKAADKDNYYKLTGTVSGFNSSYCSFDLTDDSGSIYVYNVANKADWSSKISNGGKVTLAGKYDFYAAKEQHEVIEAVILSFEEGEPVQGEAATVAEALEAEEGAVLEVGPALVVAAADQGCLIEQEGAMIYVYGKTANVGEMVTVTATRAEYGDAPQLSEATVKVVSKDNQVTYPNPKDITSSFDSYSSQIREYVTFTGKLSISNNKYFNIEVDGATVVGSIVKPAKDISSLNGKTVTITGYFLYFTTASSGAKYLYVIATDIQGDGSSGGDDPGEVTGDLSSNVEWTKGENAQDVVIKVGSTEVPGLKLGTSSKVGTATMVLKKGSTSVSFYGVSWKGNKTSVVAKVGDQVLFTQELAPNDGASNNTPFTLSVNDRDHYTKTFDALPQDTTITVTTVEGGKTRVILFGINVK